MLAQPEVWMRDGQQHLGQVLRFALILHEGSSTKAASQRERRDSLPGIPTQAFTGVPEVQVKGSGVFYKEATLNIWYAKNMIAQVVG